MGFFPTVSKGDKVRPTAAFHNAVVNTVNAVRGDPSSGKAPLSRTRVTIPVLAAEAIDAWTPLELVAPGSGFGFSYDTRCYTVRQARSQAAAVGIARYSMKANSTGSMTAFGLEIIDIPDNSTGAYAAMKAENGKMVFTRTDTPTQYLILDAKKAGERQHAHIFWRPYAEGAGADVSMAFSATATLRENSETRYDVKMLGGTVQGIFGPITAINTTIFENVGNNTFFWLQYYPATSVWQVQQGAALPASASTPSADNVNYYAVIPIFKVEKGAPNNIVQYHYGSVYVPTVTNVIQIQEPAS